MMDCCESISLSVFVLSGVVNQSIPPSTHLPPTPLGMSLSSLSVENIRQPSINCLVLLMHEMASARPRALVRAGKSMAAKIAMIAMTTNNSMRVKPTRRFRFLSAIIDYQCPNTFLPSVSLYFLQNDLKIQHLESLLTWPHGESSALARLRNTVVKSGDYVFQSN